MECLFVKDISRNLKSFETHLILSKLKGFWVDSEDNLMHAVASRITFICPMRFDKFPLDTQTCKFRVGSYSYDNSKLLYETRSFGYSSKRVNSIALDYDIRKYSCSYTLYMYVAS